LRAARAPRGVVAFAWLPVRLARATLERVERDGAGAKIGRAEVSMHLAAVSGVEPTLDAARAPRATSHAVPRVLGGR
jgi:hypothetical protein